MYVKFGFLFDGKNFYFLTDQETNKRMAIKGKQADVCQAIKHEKTNGTNYNGCGWVDLFFLCKSCF